jgi:hypothetical protein
MGLRRTFVRIIAGTETSRKDSTDGSSATRVAMCEPQKFLIALESRTAMRICLHDRAIVPTLEITPLAVQRGNNFKKDKNARCDR